MTTKQALEQDRILAMVARTLLPFGLLFGIIGAGVSMNNHSRNLYENCVGRGTHPDVCALKIYGR